MTYHRWPRYLARLIALISLLSLLALATGVGWWYLHGGQLLSVQTGSMKPVFRPGDAILLQRHLSGPLRVGEIVSYRVPASPTTVISHRIIAINGPAGTFTTKGDNLSQADLPVRRSALLGQVQLVAPHLGSLLHWVRQPLGLTCVLYLPAALIVSSEIYRYITRPRFSRYRLRGL